MTTFSLDQLSDSNDDFCYRPDPMINNIEIISKLVNVLKFINSLFLEMN